MPRRKLRNEDLREELLQRAVAVLEREGPGAVQARHVASAAGTSTGALYELFGDKAGLVRAIFYEGFRGLLDRLQQVPATADGRADVMALLAASRAFAVEHPMLFDLMYARPFSEFSPDAADLGVAGAIYELIVHRVRQWLSDAGSGTDPIDASHVLVALNRGLIASELSGLLGGSDKSRKRRWRLAVAAQLDGLDAAGRDRMERL